MKTTKLLSAGIAAAIALTASTAAHAVPKLQLYVEGAIYNTTTETWVSTVANGTFTLWVIGTPNPVSKGDITGVNLVAAYDSANGAGAVTISLAGTTTGNLGGFTDTSTPGAPTPFAEDTSETAPMMNSGASLDQPDLSLPPHGIYGAGTYWQKFAIDSFNVADIDSPTGDFITGFPSPTATDEAVIHAFDITVSGLTSGVVHWDAFGTWNGGDVFAPFSHDAEGESPPEGDIPEPGAALLLGLGLVGVGLIRRRRTA